MFRLLILVACMGLGFNASAKLMNAYDSEYSDLTDYGHSKLTDAEKLQAHEEAKDAVLKAFTLEQMAQYDRCTGGGQPSVKVEKACLQSLSVGMVI